MSEHEAVEALQSLGLSNYEAQVFIALQQLGSGTAQTVSRHSEVPRSQVYGAAEDLADRGLVELVESSPKTFRPVSLETARTQLRRRIEQQQETAFEHLEAIQSNRSERTDQRQVSTLRGQQPVQDRMVALVERADRQVVFVGATPSLVDDELATTLRTRAADGVFVMVITEHQDLGERFDSSDVEVITWTPDHSRGYGGRTLLVDEATILLSVPTETDRGEPFDEVALWTADTSIGRILARFVHAGMEHGLDDEYPATTEPDGDG